MSEIAGRHAVVTGGASRIGRLMAAKLAARGASVALWDIDQPNLERAVAELSAAASRPVRGFVCDVSDREQICARAAETAAAGGPVDILINNAGIVSGKDFLELPDDKIAATFAINVLALFWTCKAFLPSMIERNRGHVLTIASASGLIGVARLGLFDRVANFLGVNSSMDEFVGRGHGRP